MDRIIRHDSSTTRLNLLWIGLLLFMLGYAQPDIVLFSALGGILLQATKLGAVLIIFSLFASLRPSQIERSRWEWSVVILLLGWHLFMALQREALDMLAPVLYMDPYGYTLYLFPLVLLIPAASMVRSFFTICRWPILPACLLMLTPLVFYCTFGAIQFMFEGFLAACAMILMTSKYQSKNWLWIAAIGLAVAFLVATIMARRNLMMTVMLYMMGGAYMLIFQSSKLTKTTKIFIFFAGIFLAIVAAGIFLLNSSGIFSRITERAGENSREYVFLLFFWDMLQTPLDMIIGRSIRGTYECAGVDENSYETSRQAIENGYLQMMLKGGIIYIMIYMTTLTTAIKKAWSSQNQLCRAAIIIILIQIIDMIPFGLHAVNEKTFIIWMCVSICLTPSLRKMNDDEIRDLLLEKKPKLPKWEQ